MRGSRTVQYLVDKVPTRTKMIYYMYNYVHVGVVCVFWNKVYYFVYFESSVEKSRVQC